MAKKTAKPMVSQVTKKEAVKSKSDILVNPAAADLTILRKVRSIEKSPFSLADSITAQNGFIKIVTKEGKEYFQSPAEAGIFTAYLVQVMGKVPAHLVKKHKRMLDAMIPVLAQAKHQQETIQRYDTKTKTVKSGLDNIDWRKGKLTKERGAYTEDHLEEELNIDYYMHQFPFLTDSEIATILRATDVAFDMRIQLLGAKNVQRGLEAQKQDNAEIQILAAKKLKEFGQK